jgi:hypothetical protein
MLLTYVDVPDALANIITTSIAADFSSITANKLVPLYDVSRAQ